MHFNLKIRKEILILTVCLIFGEQSTVFAQMLTGETADVGGPEYMAHMRQRLERYVIREQSDEIPQLPNGITYIRILSDFQDDQYKNILVRPSTYNIVFFGSFHSTASFLNNSKSTNVPDPNIIISLGNRDIPIDKSYARVRHEIFQNQNCVIDEYGKGSLNLTVGYVLDSTDIYRGKEAASCFMSIILYHYGLHNIMMAPTDDVVIAVPHSNLEDYDASFRGAHWGASLEPINLLSIIKKNKMSGMKLSQAQKIFDQMLIENTEKQ